VGRRDDEHAGVYRISTASLVDARTEVERALEHELGFAMVPRYAIDTFDGDGGNAFMLTYPYPRVIRSASVTGVALTVGQVATISDRRDGPRVLPERVDGGVRERRGRL
jgi:hypothetical protein